MFDDDVLYAGDSGEIEAGIPLEQELDVQAKEVRLSLGERDTGLAGRPQNKIGEFGI